MKGLNANYHIIRQAEFPDIKKWTGVSIDKSFKNNRVSVQTDEYFLKKLKNTLFSKGQFEKEWKLAFMAQQSRIMKELEEPPTLDEENNLMQMDYCFYRAVAMTVYNLTLHEINEKCH